MAQFAQRRFENKNVIIDLDVFETACYVSITDKTGKKTNRKNGIVRCDKIQNYALANEVFLNWILQENNISIQTTIK